MNEYYQLLKPISGEYELDRGSIPSGFAKIKLRVEPQPSDATDVLIVLSSEQVWEEHLSLCYSSRKKVKTRKEIEAFLPIIIEGVEAGVKETLENALLLPVIGVKVIIERVYIDAMYSTKMAFQIASSLALEQMLNGAQKEGNLESVGCQG
jgi:hypothetical protein